MENLTNSQKSIWVTEQYYKGSSINNICGSATIEEQIDFEKLSYIKHIYNAKRRYYNNGLKIESNKLKALKYQTL